MLVAHGLLTLTATPRITLPPERTNNKECQPMSKRIKRRVVPLLLSTCLAMLPLFGRPCIPDNPGATPISIPEQV